jgi:hypothetical protein
MLNEEVRIAPFFIKHYDAIMKHPKLSKWTFQEKQLIHCYDTKKDVFIMQVRTYPVKKIVKALKVCGYLKPIHHGDYLLYASTLYKEDLAELEVLKYDLAVCTCLKEPKGKFISRHNSVFYADCESSTDNFHKEYNICFIRADGKCRIQLFGKD